MADWNERLRVGVAHEQRVMRELIARGWTVQPTGQGTYPAAIREALSPRFLPDEIFAVPEIPRTLTGKKQELPVKKLLLGQPIEKVVNKDAMANPASLDWFVELARYRAGPH